MLFGVCHVSCVRAVHLERSWCRCLWGHNTLLCAVWSSQPLFLYICRLFAVRKHWQVYMHMCECVCVCVSVGYRRCLHWYLFSHERCHSGCLFEFLHAAIHCHLGKWLLQIVVRWEIEWRRGEDEVWQRCYKMLLHFQSRTVSNKIVLIWNIRKIRNRS